MNTKITFGENRQVRCIEYFNELGKRHNNGDIPAMIWYHYQNEDEKDNGKRWREQYFINGHLHRDEKEGPAVIGYETDGITVSQEEYWVNGKPHRSNGLSASISYINGKVVIEGYWEDGILIKTNSN